MDSAISGGGHFVHLEAAVRLGNVDAHQPEFAGLAQQAAGDGEVLGLDLGGRRHHLVGGEVDRGLGDLPVFFGEVLRREDILRAGAPR